MVFQNYTGDRLNFGIAVERAKTEGIRVEMVIVGEDTAIPSSGRQSVGRRGLSGALFVTKVLRLNVMHNTCNNERFVHVY